jgi:hypothetical protein
MPQHIGLLKREMEIGIFIDYIQHGVYNLSLLLSIIIQRFSPDYIKMLRGENGYDPVGRSCFAVFQSYHKKIVKIKVCQSVNPNASRFMLPDPASELTSPLTLKRIKLISLRSGEVP